MDIIITGFIGLAVGASAGIALCAYQLRKTIAAQAEEIDALNKNNLRLMWQGAELAAQARDAADDLAKMRHLEELAVGMLRGEMNDHVATKRKLSAAKGQITKLKKAASGKVSGRPYSVAVGDMDIAVGGGGGGGKIGKSVGGNK